MTIIATIPWAFCVIGALVYALATGKVAELGRLAFACGLLVALFALEHASVRILP